MLFREALNYNLKQIVICLAQCFRICSIKFNNIIPFLFCRLHSLDHLLEVHDDTLGRNIPKMFTI